MAVYPSIYIILQYIYIIYSKNYLEKYVVKNSTVYILEAPSTDTKKTSPPQHQYCISRIILHYTRDLLFVFFFDITAGRIILFFFLVSVVTVILQN